MSATVWADSRLSKAYYAIGAVAGEHEKSTVIGKLLSEAMDVIEAADVLLEKTP